MQQATRGRYPGAPNFVGPAPWPPIEREQRSHIPTDCAAYHLNRKPKTLRLWAHFDNGPLRPARINGRLAWPVAEIRRLLEVSA